MSFRYKRLVLDLNKVKEGFYFKRDCFIVINVEKYNPVLNKNIYFVYYVYHSTSISHFGSLSSNYTEKIHKYSLKQAELEDKFLVLK